MKTNKVIDVLRCIKLNLNNKHQTVPYIMINAKNKFSSFKIGGFTNFIIRSPICQLVNWKKINNS